MKINTPSKIVKLKLAFGVSLRKAKIQDAKLLLRIHNNSVKMGFFNSKDLITLKEHIKWLRKKINSSSKIYIGRDLKKKDFGYVRFDKVKNNIFEVSIGNLPSFYGKGLGTLMLEKAIKKFKMNYKTKKIISVVKKSNTRSMKCFLKNGFVKTNFNEKKHSTINKINPKIENYFELKTV